MRLKYFILLLIAFKLSFMKLMKTKYNQNILILFFLSGIKFTIILIFWYPIFLTVFCSYIALQINKRFLYILMFIKHYT